MLKWPASSAESAAGRPDTPPPDRARRRRGRSGALVILVNGALAAYLSRRARQLLAYLPEDEPQRSAIGAARSRPDSRRWPAAAAC